jgi:hypothetical protein
VNATIAEYHVPVNADVPDIQVIFVDEPDDVINPLGNQGRGRDRHRRHDRGDANAIYHWETRAGSADHDRQAAALKGIRRVKPSLQRKVLEAIGLLLRPACTA